MTDEVVAQHACNTADELLDALNPRTGILSKDSGRWVFRGLRDAKYELLPSAHRKEPWRIYCSDAFDPSNASEIERLAAERDLLRWFRRSLDRAGLRIPEEDAIVRGALADDSNEMFGEVIPLLAFAQHHGLPTRLLDWTERCSVAAYFAAEDPYEHIKARELAVWALDRHYVRRFGAPKKHPDETEIHVTTAPRGSNPNLHAQAGGFTYCEKLDSLEPLDRVLQAVFARNAHAEGEVELPLMHRFVLPREQARRVLVLLHAEGISGLSLFPSVAGVTAHLRESVWCGSKDGPNDGW